MSKSSSWVAALKRFPFVRFYIRTTHTLCLEERSNRHYPKCYKSVKRAQRFDKNNVCNVKFLSPKWHGVQQGSFQSSNVLLMYKRIHVTIPYNENWATHSIDNNNHSNNMTKTDWLSSVQHVFRTFVSLPSNILPLHHINLAMQLIAEISVWNPETSLILKSSNLLCFTLP